MFEKKKKFIYDFNINQLKKLGPYFTLEKLAEIEIHPAIETYVNAAVDYQIYQDRQALIGNSVFDYSGDEVAGYLASIDDILKKRKKFSLKYFAGIIEEAINFNVEYIASPKNELHRLVFQDKNHMPVQEIIQRLKHIYYYEYFNKVISSFISKKKIIALNRDEFTELLNRVDNLSTESNQKEILETFVNAASSFYNIGNAKQNNVPFEAFILFISGKELQAYEETIKQSAGDAPRDEYDPAWYIKLINTVVEEKVEYVNDYKSNDESEEGLDSFDGGEYQTMTPADESEETPEENIDQGEDFSDELPDENLVEMFNLPEPEDVDPDEEKFEDEPFPAADEIEVEPENAITSFFGGIDPDDSVNDEEEFIVADSINLEDFDEESAEAELPDEEETDNSPEDLADFPDFDFEEQDSESFESLEDTEEQEISLPEDEENEVENIPGEFAEDDNSFLDFDDDENDPISFDEWEEETKTPADETFTGLDEEAEKTPAEDDEEETPLSSINASMGIAFNQEEHLTPPRPSSSVIDPTEILDNSKMPKIIQEIFDFDMEEFADTIELIAHADSREKAMSVLEELFTRNGVDRNSKEAQNLVEIILQYFD